MKIIKLNMKYIILSLMFVFAINNANAAKLSIFPASGNISVERFDISVLAESVETEPGMIAAEVVLNYSGDVRAVDVKSTAFETIESREITDNQVKFVVRSNPAAPKSGTVRAAMITFETTNPTGAVNFEFDSASRIIGQNDVNILTESTEYGEYQIAVQSNTQNNVEDTNTEQAAPVQTTPAESNSNTVPATGGVNNYLLWTSVTGVLLLAGYLVWNNK